MRDNGVFAIYDGIGESKISSLIHSMKMGGKDNKYKGMGSPASSDHNLKIKKKTRRFDMYTPYKSVTLKKKTYYNDKILKVI